MTIDENNPEIILASGSPRRLELMQRVGFLPRVIVSSVPETIEEGESPGEYTARLSQEKARDVANRHVDDDDLPSWILAADTVVVFDGDILEKPATDDEAAEMLRRLSGRAHDVVTSFCWRRRDADAETVRTVVTAVQFRQLDEETIQRYVGSGEPTDKAGAYGIQGLGSALVRSISGSYFAVVGLPVCEVVEELQRLEALVGYPFRA